MLLHGQVGRGISQTNIQRSNAYSVSAMMMFAMFATSIGIIFLTE